uniref:Ankyrin repeat and SOCS box containing 14b n=1 Tax=Cyclopterus lumpus TaxID=8103 RepID=A0A8C2XK13_CYCLU
GRAARRGEVGGVDARVVVHVGPELQQIVDQFVVALSESHLQAVDGVLVHHRPGLQQQAGALALEHLIPVTELDAVKQSGMSPLHSAAAGGHAHCVEALLKAGYDPNFMLHPRVRRDYADERRSALFFAVSNNDLQCARLLLEAGAMVNQDPVNCLQVALRQGNYELINNLLKFGANVNYYSRVNTTHFPSALQHALNDEVMLRMILNHGYDVKRCFECPYGDGSIICHYGTQGCATQFSC